MILQSAKSAALGPRRQMDALSEVLAEPMLTRFQSEAAKAEETGWFWKYKCNSVKVNPWLLKPCMAASKPVCAELNTAAIEFYGLW